MVARTFRSIMALVAALALGIQGVAQPPPLPSDLLDGSRTGRRLTGNSISFCVDPRSPGHEIDREIAREIADRLLLEPEFHVIDRRLVAEDFEYVYVDLVEGCHVTLGFKLLADAYPDWVVSTRAYYETSYVMVVDDPTWEALEDIPRDEPVGSVPGTAGDIRLLTYLNSLPDEQRWSRHPRGSDQAALQAVVDGDLGGALVWGPALWRLQQEIDAFNEVHWFRVQGVSEDVGVGGLLLRGNSFVRSSVDDAIASLVADGAIGDILEANSYPARPPQAR